MTLFCWVLDLAVWKHPKMIFNLNTILNCNWITQILLNFILAMVNIIYSNKYMISRTNRPHFVRSTTRHIDKKLSHNEKLLCVVLKRIVHNQMKDYLRHL